MVKCMETIVVTGYRTLADLVPMAVIPLCHLCEGGVRVRLLVGVENLTHLSGVGGEPDSRGGVEGDRTHGGFVLLLLIY